MISLSPTNEGNKSKGGWKPIPEGEHLFTVEEVEYDKDFGIMEMELITDDGQKHTEKFHLQDNEGDINQGALNVFSYTARVLMNDFGLKQVDHRALVGRKMIAEVKHNKVKSRKDPNKTLTFVNLGKKKIVEDQVEETTLDDLLGD